MRVLPTRLRGESCSYLTISNRKRQSRSTAQYSFRLRPNGASGYQTSTSIELMCESSCGRGITSFAPSGYLPLRR